MILLAPDACVCSSPVALTAIFDAPLESIMGGNSEQLKLDARATRIENQNALGHDSRPDRLFCHLAVGKEHGDSAGSHTGSDIIRTRGQNNGYAGAEHDAGRIGSGKK